VQEKKMGKRREGRDNKLVEGMERGEKGGGQKGEKRRGKKKGGGRKDEGKGEKKG
jgi:hypothetical protein